MGNARICTIVHLSETERRELYVIAQSPALTSAIRLRARALLMSDRVAHPDATDVFVAESLGVSKATVASIRKRYTQLGVMFAVWPQWGTQERIQDVASSVSGSGGLRLA
jgi:hypothetical protein